MLALCINVSLKEKYRNYVFDILLYKHTKNLLKYLSLILKFLAVFKYFLQPTQCQHHDKSPGPSETVEKRPVLCERLHEGLTAVVDGEGGDLEQQQLRTRRGMFVLPEETWR